MSERIDITTTSNVAMVSNIGFCNVLRIHCLICDVDLVSKKSPFFDRHGVHQVISPHAWIASASSQRQHTALAASKPRGKRDPEATEEEIASPKGKYK